MAFTNSLLASLSVPLSIYHTALDQCASLRRSRLILPPHALFRLLSYTTHCTALALTVPRFSPPFALSACFSHVQLTDGDWSAAANCPGCARQLWNSNGSLSKTRILNRTSGGPSSRLNRETREAAAVTRKRLRACRGLYTTTECRMLCSEVVVCCVMWQELCFALSVQLSVGWLIRCIHSRRCSAVCHGPLRTSWAHCHQCRVQ